MSVMSSTSMLFGAFSVGARGFIGFFVAGRVDFVHCVREGNPIQRAGATAVKKPLGDRVVSGYRRGNGSVGFCS
jgi:hypothetical protein